MPDRKLTQNFGDSPDAIARSLGEHRAEMGESMEDLGDEVRSKAATAKRAVMFVPNKLKAAGGAGKRASGKAVAFAKERPIVAGAIGAATVGLIGAGVMVAKRRRTAKAAAATIAAKATGKSKSKGGGKRRRAKR